jgi:serine/threonine protein kinase
MSVVLTTGSIVAGYRISRLIGRGSTGAVYLAEGSDGGQVALKVLIPELAQDPRFRERFLREAEIAAALDEPHVVPTIAMGDDDGILYLVMRYVDGLDLRETLKREGPLPAERAVDLVGQVASALDAAHALGLVHRDVKPGNVLLTSTDTGEHAYLCDFGLAKHLSSVNSLTGERAFVGTIAYIAPEQIEGAAIDARADVYSLGCMLFECLTGEAPFTRESELATNLDTGIVFYEDTPGDAAGNTLKGNTANKNQNHGIDASAGTIDAGGNRAFGNAISPQCLNVICWN